MITHYLSAWLMHLGAHRASSKATRLFLAGQSFCFGLYTTLHGMRDSPRSYAKLFDSICKSFDAIHIKTDELRQDCQQSKRLPRQRRVCRQACPVSLSHTSWSQECKKKLNNHAGPGVWQQLPLQSTHTHTHTRRYTHAHTNICILCSFLYPYHGRLSDRLPNRIFKSRLHTLWKFGSNLLYCGHRLNHFAKYASIQSEKYLAR